LLRLHELAATIVGAPPLDPSARQDDRATSREAAPADQRRADPDGFVASPPVGSRSPAASGAVGKAAVLVGIIGAPALILGAGGLLHLKRNRQQQQELTAKLDQAEAELAATMAGIDALENLLPRATQSLDYIATHAGHALSRWEQRLPPSSAWESLGRPAQRRYRDFAEIAAAQARIVTIIPANVQGLLTTRGTDQAQLIHATDGLLTDSMRLITALV
jgi:hypothetical protein